MADDFIKQVNEEIQAQRLRAVVRRFGALAVIVVVGAALGGGAWGWHAHTIALAKAKASARYFEALHSLEGPSPDKARIAHAQAVFADLAAHALDGTRSYAAMRLADIRLQADDTPAALAAWQGVINDAQADPALRNMARYLSLNAQTNTGDPAVLRSGYEALAQENDGPWASLAQEGLAALDLRPGSTDAQHQEARRILTQLAGSASATPGSRARAQALLETFGDAG